MKPVLFWDSGIGGIPYCRHFYERNPGEDIVYLADRLHFPYGEREQKELAAILIALMEQVIRSVDPKMVVLACNTASLAALSALRKHFPTLPFVGTVPAVKPAVLASKTGKIGVLGTKFTIEESYIRELAAEHGDSEIVGIAAPELVAFVETRLDSASPEETKAMVRGYLNRFRAANVDSVVLGCTHFLFLLEDFQREAAPDITVFESIDGITRRIESLLVETAPSEKNNANTDTAAQKLLLLTGSDSPQPSWVSWAERLGFSIAIMG